MLPNKFSSNAKRYFLVRRRQLLNRSEVFLVWLELYTWPLRNLQPSAKTYQEKKLILTSTLS